jgi:hypothetical protein
VSEHVKKARNAGEHGVHGAPEERHRGAEHQTEAEADETHRVRRVSRVHDHEDTERDEQDQEHDDPEDEPGHEHQKPRHQVEDPADCVALGQHRERRRP